MKLKHLRVATQRVSANEDAEKHPPALGETPDQHSPASTIETPEWWEGLRIPVAFLVAPLAAPLVIMVGFGTGENSAGSLNALIFVVVTLIAYVGTIVFGLPLFIFCVARNLTAFIIAPICGAVVGAVFGSFVIGGVFFGTYLPPSSLGGFCGAAVGAVLWLIARPDR